MKHGLKHNIANVISAHRLNSVLMGNAKRTISFRTFLYQCVKMRIVPTHATWNRNLEELHIVYTIVSYS